MAGVLLQRRPQAASPGLVAVGDSGGSPASTDFDSAWSNAMASVNGDIQAPADPGESDSITEDLQAPHANPNWPVYTRGGADRPVPHYVDPHTGLMPPPPIQLDHPDLRGPQVAPGGVSPGDQPFWPSGGQGGQGPIYGRSGMQGVAPMPPQLLPAGESPAEFGSGADFSRIPFHEPIGPNLRALAGGQFAGPQQAPPAPGSVAPPAPDSMQPFTPIPTAAVPPQLQPFYQQMQADYQRQVAELNGQREAMARAQQFDPLLQRIESDPGFRSHLLQYGQQPAPAPAPQEPALDDSTWDDDTKAIVGALNQHWGQRMQHLENRFQSALQERIAPVQQMKDRVEALAEMQTFEQQHPSWRQFVHSSALAEGKRLRPDLPVETIYRTLAFPAFEQLALRGGVQPQPTQTQAYAQPQQTQPQLVDLNELVGRRPPPATPRVRQEIDQLPKDFDSSWSLTMQQLGLA